jgi:protein-disulfide isomerase
VANKTKRYDLKAADRRRNRLIQAGLTLVVVIFAVGMVLLIVKPWEHNSSIGQAVTVSAPDKLVKDQSGKPKVVLSMYEDFLCPHCGSFEKTMGPTVRQLIGTGAVQADYYMVSLVDRGPNGYSTRAANAAYCVAEADTSPNKEAFQRFHDALFKEQPTEGASSYPSNKDLIEKARLSGLASESLSKCINNGKYTKQAEGMLEATGIHATPTIRINGQDFPFEDTTTPQQLVDAVTKITGPVPGLTAVPPAPPAPAPAPAPASP